MKSNEFITERGRNGSDEFAVDPTAKPAEIPAWLKKAGTWLGNKIGLKEPVALPDYTASNQQDAAARSGYTGIDPIQRQQAGMAPATQQEINRYMRDNPAVVGGLTDRNGNPIASGGAQEVERAARAAAPRRGADFDVDAEVGAVDPAVIGNRFKTPRELGFQPGGSTASAAEKSDDITLDKIKAAAGIPAAATPEVEIGAPIPARSLKTNTQPAENPAAEVEIGAPIPARSLKTNTQPAVKKSFDEPVAAAAAPMKGGYGSGMNNPSVAQQTRVAESDTNRILELAGLLKPSEFLNEAPAATAPVNPTMTSRTMGASELSADPVQNFKAGVQDAKEFYDLARTAGVPVSDAIPMAYAKGQATATGDIGSFVAAVTDKATGTAEKGLSQLQSTIKDYADLYAQFQPTSEYYKKNIAPNPQLKAQADEFIRTNVTPQQYAQSIQQAQAQLKAPRVMPTQASAAVPGNPFSQPPAATNETTEINRILKLSGMEFISEGSTKSITVQRGDTLSRIAQNNSTTVAAIVKLNNIANPDRIYPGDVIRIPTGQVDVPGGRTKRQGSTRLPDRAEKLTTTTSTGNPKIAMEFFLDQGWTPEQAAGLVANLQAESYDHIDPAAFNAKEQAYGIAQWRGPRKRDFEREMGRPIKGSSLDDQLRFVQWELNNTEKRAGRRLKQATTAAEAAAIVDEFYERSAGIHRQERIALANSLLTAFA